MTEKQKITIEEAAIKAWEADAVHNPNPNNPHAYVYGFKQGAKEVTEHPERYELVQRYIYTTEVDHVKRLMSLLRDIDDLLMSLEDYTHGKDGQKITKLRHKIEVEIP